jgi:PPOX class probable F420-dependent enzyme
MTPLPVSTYVSLTTFRRTGVPVSTPVWAAPDGDTLVVWTRADSGKRKHPLPPTARKLAPGPCRGPRRAVDGVAEFVPDDGRPQAIAALRAAYGLKFTLGNTTSRLWHRLTRRSGDRHEIIRIRPA